MPRLLASFDEPLVPTIRVTLLWLMFAASLEEALLQLVAQMQCSAPEEPPFGILMHPGVAYDPTPFSAPLDEA